MIQICYGEHCDLADLAGRSVAEAREQYKSEFDIPDRAQAILNDKLLKKKLEDWIMLEDGDDLSFEEKKRSKKSIFAACAGLGLTKLYRDYPPQ